MDPQVRDDLGVGGGVSDLGRATEMAQEGHVGQAGNEVRHQARDRDGDTTALTGARHRDLRRIDRWMATRSLDRPNAIRIYAAIVVSRWVADAAGHIAR